VRGDTLVVGSERNIYTVEQLVAREQNLTVHILLNQAREDPLGIVTSEVLQDVTKHRADVSLLEALLEISYLANQLGLLSSHSLMALILKSHDFLRHLVRKVFDFASQELLFIVECLQDLQVVGSDELAIGDLFGGQLGTGRLGRWE